MESLLISSKMRREKLIKEMHSFGFNRSCFKYSLVAAAAPFHVSWLSSLVSALLSTRVSESSNKTPVMSTVGLLLALLKAC